LPKSAPAHHEAGLPEPKPTDDPLHPELAKQARELEEAQKRLTEELRRLDLLQEDDVKTAKELAALEGKRGLLDKTRAELEKTAAEHGKTVQGTAVSLADIMKRRQKLMDDIQALEKLPPVKKTLRYRTPVSQPVHAEELHFECQHGKVTFIDVQTLVGDIRRHMEEKVEELRANWQVRDATDAVGAFRMHYVIERFRGGMDSVFSAGGPNGGNFSYGLSEWFVEPVIFDRGETALAALAAHSEFRHIVDGLSPTQAVVTFWVYPDSFELYRQLRDFLQDHDITVAGRPLPAGVPIASSRRGSVSRGQ
jgi:hypothetical protein